MAAAAARYQRSSLCLDADLTMPAVTESASTSEMVMPAVPESVGADLFKRAIWIPTTATVGFVGFSIVHGGTGVPHLAVVIGACACLAAQVVAWLWASVAWREFGDRRFPGAIVLGVAGGGLVLWGTLGQAQEPLLRTFRIGLRPNDVAFTPGAMWVSDLGASVVYRVADGGIVPVSVVGAFEIVADGSSVWVSQPTGITQLDADGDVVRSVPLPGLPGDMVVTGRFLWLTLPGLGQVGQVDLQSGAPELHSVGREPVSIAYARGTIWVTDATTDQLFAMDVNSAALLHTFPTGRSPYGVFAGGDRVWVANTDSDTVTEVDVRTGAHREFRVPAHPTDLVAHEGSLWILSETGHTVSVVDTATSEVEREVDLGGQPLKLEVHDGAMVISNPDLGVVQQVRLRDTEAPA